MLIYLIGFLAAIWGVNSQIVIDPTSCANLMLTVQAAVDEMLNMCNTARTRIANAGNGNPPTSASEMRLVIYLLDAIFASLSNPQGQTHATDMICKSLLINIY